MLLQVLRVDRAGGRIDGKQHGTLEAVALGEDLAQLRQGLLGAILLIARNQHDVLSLARAVAALVDDPRVRSASIQGNEKYHEPHGQHGAGGLATLACS